MTKKILAIIPARGGSKGIKKKNIIDLAGKPLIAWTIEASLNSKYITKTIVSSDNDEILNVAKKYGASTLKRPSVLSTDTSSSQSVIEHAIDTLTEQYEYIILLQPTSPLRNTSNINDAIDLFFKSNATALISVTRTDNKILKAFKQREDNFIEPISKHEYPFTPRQNLPDTFISNGAIYIVKIDDFIQSKSLLSNKTIHYIMNNESSIDIDTKEDLYKANHLLSEDSEC